MATMDENALKIRMLYRNIFPLTGNWKYICNGNHILMQNFHSAKDLQKLGTIELRIIRKKSKITVRCFQRKFEVGKKKLFSQ